MEIIKSDPLKSFHLEKKIGKGTYGEVWQARWKNSGQPVAIKIIDDITEALEEVKETRALNRLCFNHSNLPKFMGVYLNNPIDDILPPQVWIVMELCGGGTVTELSRKCAKSVACLITTCPKDLLKLAPSAWYPLKSRITEILSKLATSHCPCLMHRRQRSKQSLETILRSRSSSSSRRRRRGESEDETMIATQLLFVKSDTVDDVQKARGGLEVGRMPLNVIRYLIYSTTSALMHLHSYGVIHRDVKGSNILLTLAGEVKLVDFGISCRLKDSLSGRTTIIGTPYWMAPEVINTEVEDGYDTRADVWSMGITGLELWESEPPLAGIAPMKAFSLITHGPHPLSMYARKSSSHRYDESYVSSEVLGHQLDTLPADFFDFLAKCLEKEQERRSTTQELLNHRFLVKTPKYLPQLQEATRTLMQHLNGDRTVETGRDRPSASPIDLPQRRPKTGCAVGRTHRMSLQDHQNKINPNSCSSTALESSKVAASKKFTSKASLNLSTHKSELKTVTTTTDDSKRQNMEGCDDHITHHELNNDSAYPDFNRSEPGSKSYVKRSTSLGFLSNAHPLENSHERDCINDTNPTLSSKQMLIASTHMYAAEFDSGHVGSMQHLQPSFDEDDSTGKMRLWNYELGVAGESDMVSSGKYEHELKDDILCTEVNGVLVCLCRQLTDDQPMASESPVLPESVKTLITHILEQARRDYKEQNIFIIGTQCTQNSGIYDKSVDFLLQSIAPNSINHLQHHALICADILTSGTDLSLKSCQFRLNQSSASESPNQVYVSKPTTLCSTNSWLDNDLLIEATQWLRQRFEIRSNLLEKSYHSELKRFHESLLACGLSENKIVEIYSFLLVVVCVRERSNLFNLDAELFSDLPQLLFKNLEDDNLNPNKIQDSERSQNNCSTNHDLLKGISNLLGLNAENLQMRSLQASSGPSRHVISRHFWRQFSPFKQNHQCSQSDSGYFGKVKQIGLFPSVSLLQRIKWTRKLPHAFMRCLPRRKTTSNMSSSTESLLLRFDRIMKRHGKRSLQWKYRCDETFLETLARNVYSLLVSTVFDQIQSHLGKTNGDSSSENSIKVNCYHLQVRCPIDQNAFSKLTANSIFDFLHCNSTRKPKNPSESNPSISKNDAEELFGFQATNMFSELLKPKFLLRRFLEETFSPSKSSNGFSVNHYHDKENYLFSDVLKGNQPKCQTDINALFSESSIPTVARLGKKDSVLSTNAISASKSGELINWFSMYNKSFNQDTHLVSLLSVPAHFQPIDRKSSNSLSSPSGGAKGRLVSPKPAPLLSLFSNILSDDLCNQMQANGLLNFASAPQSAPRHLLMTGQEFCRRFLKMDFITPQRVVNQYEVESSSDSDFRSLVSDHKESIKSRNKQLHHRSLPECIRQRIAGVLQSYDLKNEALFISSDWVLLTHRGLSLLLTELNRRRNACRKIQRWWRHFLDRPVKNVLQTRLTDISNLIPDYTANVCQKEAHKVSLKNSNNLTPNGDYSISAYVVTNTVHPMLARPQSMNNMQSSTYHQRNNGCNCCSGLGGGGGGGGGAVRRPWEQDTPNSQSPTQQNAISDTRGNRNQHIERSVSQIYLRSNYAPKPPPHHVLHSHGNCNKQTGADIAGVQRRRNSRTPRREELEEREEEEGERRPPLRRPVSWHIGKMEDYVSTHLAKQRVLNGDGLNTEVIKDQETPPNEILKPKKTDQCLQKLLQKSQSVSTTNKHPHHRLPKQHSADSESAVNEYARLQAQITAGVYRKTSAGETDSRLIANTAQLKNKFRHEICDNQRQHVPPSNSRCLSNDHCALQRIRLTDDHPSDVIPHRENTTVYKTRLNSSSSSSTSPSTSSSPTSGSSFTRQSPAYQPFPSLINGPMTPNLLHGLQNSTNSVPGEQKASHNQWRRPTNGSRYFRCMQANRYPNMDIL